ncbi:MAG: cyclic nucleotide-binding domain-containing protein [Cytophagales bacterium]|nr:cyclic nucleotide-binding domain-containing protein [Cytophagales bacterium]
MKDYMNVIPLFDALKSEDLHLASDSFELRTYGSDDAILRAGSVCKHLYFIFKGLVYSYANDENEKILWYEFERSSFTDTVSFYTQTPSRNFIKAADNETALICISFEHLQQIYQ